jgi:hypothetical protein
MEQNMEYKMKKFYTYSEFLNEREVTVPTFTSTSQIATKMIDSAKREKLIAKAKKLDNMQLPMKIVDGSQLDSSLDEYSFTTLSGKDFSVTSSEKFSSSQGSDFKMLVYSSQPFSLSDVEDAIVEKAMATYRNVIYTYTRKLVKDHSTSIGNLIDIRSGSNKKFYFMLFDYTSTESKGESVTFDMAKNTKAFKALMDAVPLIVVSNQRQLKNGTIIFRIPASHIVDPSGKSLTSDGKFKGVGYGLSSTGYIRRFYLTGDSEMIGRFDSTSLEKWEEAFSKIEKIFKKDIEDLKSQGVKVVSSPEEREKYRGMITGYSFGI